MNFIAEGPKETRVELEHRHLGRMGPKSAEVRIHIDGPGGWGSILEAYKPSPHVEKIGGRMDDAENIRSVRPCTPPQSPITRLWE